MIELPDDAERDLRTLLRQLNAPTLGNELLDKVLARVRAETAAERAAIIEVIQRYLPEALPFNTLPEIVGGIARQRDFQHDLKDHLADVARRLTDERDAALAEAVASERQRIKTSLLEEFYEDNPATERDHGYNAGIQQAIWVMESGFATGSVPVAGEPEVVAWAVRAADGMVYVPGDSPIQAGTKKQAERVAARNQGKGGVWTVVPLVASSVPVATLQKPHTDYCGLAAHSTCTVSGCRCWCHTDPVAKDQTHDK